MNTYSRIRAWAADRSFRPSPSALLCGALLAPMGVAFEIPADSVSTDSTSASGFERITRFTFGGGGGTYGRTIHAERTISLGFDSCTGLPQSQTFDADFRFKNEFHDYGGEIDVQATKKVHVGVRGGVINETGHYWGTSADPAVIDTVFGGVNFPDSTLSNTYVNPFFSIEGRDKGFGLGFVFATNRLWTDQVRDYNEFNNSTVYPTGHIRFGRLDRAYVKASLWEGVPIYSGGGMWVLGLGVRPAPLDLFLGYEMGGPYTDNNVVLRGSLDVGRHLVVGGNVRLSSDSDTDFMPTISEHGGSLFLTYKLITH